MNVPDSIRNGKTGWWVAGVLIALMVGGLGMIYQSIQSPTQEQVDHIQEVQAIVLQRLATQDERMNGLRADIARLQQDLNTLQIQIQDHVTEDRTLRR